MLGLIAMLAAGWFWKFTPKALIAVIGYPIIALIIASGKAGWWKQVGFNNINERLAGEFFGAAIVGAIAYVISASISHFLTQRKQKKAAQSQAQI